MSKIPVASAVEAVEAVEESIVSVMLSSMKELSLEELVVLNQEGLKLIKTGMKGAPKKKAVAVKKAPNAAIVNNQHWTHFVEEYSKANGWPEHIANETDKETKIKGEVVRAESVETEDGQHVFSDTFKPFTYKNAMTLASLYWKPANATRKVGEGLREDLYEEFLLDIEENPEKYEPKEKVKVELTEEEKEAKKEAANEKRRATIAAKKAAAAAAVEAAKPAPVAAIAALKKVAAKTVALKPVTTAIVVAKPVVAAKAAPVAAKAAPVVVKAAPVAAKAAPMKAGAVKTAVSKAKVEVIEEPAKLSPREKLAAAKAAKAAKEAKVEAMEVDNVYVDTFKASADDGFADPWDWNGRPLMRNCHNFVWERTDDNDYGAYVGQYDPATNKIDDSVEEPEFQ